MESLASLSDRRRARRCRAGGARTASGGEQRRKVDGDEGQRNAVHFFAVLGDAWTARHHPSTDGVSSSGRQQLHRTVPSQLERGGSLDGGVSELGGSASIYRSLDRGVQSRPASPRSRESHSTRCLLAFLRCTTTRHPHCLTYTRSLHS